MSSLVFQEVYHCIIEPFLLSANRKTHPPPLPAIPPNCKRVTITLATPTSPPIQQWTITRVPDSPQPIKSRLPEQSVTLRGPSYSQEVIYGRDSKELLNKLIPLRLRLRIRHVPNCQFTISTESQNQSSEANLSETASMKWRCHARTLKPLSCEEYELLIDEDYEIKQYNLRNAGKLSQETHRENRKLSDSTHELSTHEGNYRKMSEHVLEREKTESPESRSTRATLSEVLSKTDFKEGITLEEFIRERLG